MSWRAVPILIVVLAVVLIVMGLVGGTAASLMRP